MQRDSSVLSRELCLASPFLTFLTPARIRVLRELHENRNTDIAPSIAQLGSLLKISEQDAALVKDPLQCPRIRASVEAEQDCACTLLDPAYPPRLREIHDPPLVLFLRGNRDLLRTPAVAIVGSRRASRYGLEAAGHFARKLGQAGLTIVSGFARGVDAAAHRAALESDASTIGVLGTGIDVRYPRDHDGLRSEIESRGLLLSEFAPGTPPRPANFPIRNRVISGCCLATIVIEAGKRSGSLITARMALEQGREVFALPGPIFAEGSEGPNRLIQSGAKLLHSVDDFFEEFPEIIKREIAAPVALDCEEPLRSLLEILSFDSGVHIDWIERESGIPQPALAEAMLELELRGLIRSIPGARYVRTMGR